MSIEAMKQALEALERLVVGSTYEDAIATEKAITALRTAIAESEKQEPVAIRIPKEGDRVICIEDDSAGTVWWTAAGGGPYIKFDDGSYGQWSLREFGNLFRYTAPPQQEKQEPVAWLTKELMADYLDMVAEAIEDNSSEALRHKAHWMRVRGEE